MTEQPETENPASSEEVVDTKSLGSPLNWVHLAMNGSPRDKRWQATAYANCLLLEWGKGKLTHSKFLYSHECQDGDPEKELSKRSAAKKNKGYRIP